MFRENIEKIKLKHSSYLCIYFENSNSVFEAFVNILHQTKS